MVEPIRRHEAKMILMKRLSSKEVLELLGHLAQEDLPDGAEGNLHLRYDDDDGVEIFFIEKSEETIQS